jgi:UDP-galactopyranose mutase
VQRLQRETEELDKILNESNIQISVITESKKKLQETKETEHYTVVYSGVDRYTRGQSRVMIWIHKSIFKIFQSCVK